MTGIPVGPFEGTPVEWDAFARANSGWSHFHLWAWRRVIERVHRHECVFFSSKCTRALLDPFPCEI